MIGYNFKSDIYFYKILRNMNGKINYKVYINQIFYLIIKSYIEIYYDCVLEKNNNSDNRLEKSNIIWILKKSNNLES